MKKSSGHGHRPLAGVKVLELGQLVAAPFATSLMAEFGAEVIKVEPPGGDPLRHWRTTTGETSPWWIVQSQNKKCVTADLRQPAGQELARQLASRVDILVENFRPGTLEKWGLAPATLQQANPGLIVVRISGFGQTGPYRDRPGFGSVGESMGGLRYLTGYPDRPPVRSNLSVGDAVAALYAFSGALMALYHRDQRDGRGQVVDVALYEAIFGMTEGLVPEFHRNGVVRERSGNRIAGVAPQGTYPCADGRYAVIGGNADNIFKRLMAAMGRNDLAEDARYVTNAGRVQAADLLDEAIAEWTSLRPLDQVVQMLTAAGVPVSSIYSVADMMADPHFRAREMIEEVAVPGMGTVKIPAVVPRLSETPGGTEWPGPGLGAHNDEIFGELLGIDPQRLATLRRTGVIR